MSNFYQKLCDAIGAASVREQEPMSAHTTFRAGGPARYFVTPEGDGFLRLQIKIFTGETTEKYLQNLRSRTGHTVKKMIESYEKNL